MARTVQDIALIEYDGPQGNRVLEMVESSNINRTKARNRVKTMNRARRAKAFQSGVEEVNVTLTVVPELVDPEVDWHRSWKQDELFTLIFEKGLDGYREQVVDCMVADVNDTFNEAGEARQEITVEGLASIAEPT